MRIAFWLGIVAVVVVAVILQRDRDHQQDSKVVRARKAGL